MSLTEENQMEGRNKCNHCMKYASEPIWGHSSCSYHRKCTASDMWAPSQCDDCLESRNSFFELSLEEQVKSREELVTMVKKSVAHKATRGKDWAYDQALNSFLEEEQLPEGAVTPCPSEVDQDDYQSPGRASHDLPCVSPEPEDPIATRMSAMEETLKQLVRGMKRNRSPSWDDYSQSPRRRNKTPNRSVSPTNSYYSDGHSRREYTSCGPNDSLWDSAEPKRKPHFFEEGETLIIYNSKIHNLMGNHKVLVNHEAIDVKWHHRENAFAQIKYSAKRNSPYVDPDIGHQNLMSALELLPCSGDPPGAKRKCFSANFDNDSGLATALKSIKDKDSKIMQSLFSNNDDEFRRCFSEDTFRAVSMANFTSGWSLTGSEYLAWAKFAPLDVIEISEALGDSSPIRVKKELLEEEKQTRMELVNFLTAMNLLEKLQKKVNGDPSTYSIAMAISRHILTSLKKLTISWMTAKFEIRKEILKGKDSQAANQLFKSTLWDPAIFPKEVFETLKTKGPDKSIKHMLGNQSKPNYIQRSFNNPGFQVRSRQKYADSQYDRPSTSFVKTFRDKSPYKATGRKQTNSGFKKQSKGPFNKQSGKYANSPEKQHNQNRSTFQKGKNFAGHSKFSKRPKKNSK